MISLLKFVLNVNFIVGFVLGGCGAFIYLATKKE